LTGSLLTGDWYGSVLGPVLFLIFISDLDAGLSSHVLKFADDTKLYRAINSPTESQSPQTDLDSVSNWAKCWEMEFNDTKYKVMNYGKGNNHFSYFMNEQEIEDVDHEKDLEVMFSSDLNVSAHCKEAYSNENGILDLINRTIMYKHSATLIILYTSMVRPHLEYCSVVWSPHYNKDKML